MASTINVNGRDRAHQDAGDVPLLWFLRDRLNLTGTKYGCGIGLCGACTVLVDGEARRACLTTLADVAGGRIVTAEGLAQDGRHALQQAWIDEQVPQCGYCQSGMILAALSLLNAVPDPTDAQIDEAITNICRCGTYPRLRTAIRRAARILAAGAAVRG